MTSDFPFSTPHLVTLLMIHVLSTHPKKIQLLEAAINNDLKCVTQWLNANRLSLNVDKTKLIILHSKQEKINIDNLVIKLNQSILIPCNYVKYLGVYIDKNLSWDIHTQQLRKKLSRANGILSKFRHFAPLSTLISVYSSIFHSHLIYGCPVWSMTSRQKY